MKHFGGQLSLALGDVRRRQVTGRRTLGDLIRSVNPWMWEIPTRIEQKFQQLEARAITVSHDDENAMPHKGRAKRTKSDRP